MGDTAIEWTRGEDGSEGKTWNCIRGCSRTSPGCGGGTPGPLKGGCYAEAIAERFSGPGQPFEGFAVRGKGWTRKVALVPEKLAEPLSWRKPCRVFANSMSDLFHDELSNEEIAAVFGVIAAAPHLTFQVLTKRAERMRDWFVWARGAFTERQRGIASAPNTTRAMIDAAFEYLGAVWKPRLDAAWRHVEADPWPLPNIWIGVSVEDQVRAEERIKPLLETPSVVRFLSVEPLLGPVDLTRIVEKRFDDMRIPAHVEFDGLRGFCGYAKDGSEDRRGIDWCIVGSESGRGARPMAPEWARKIVDDCIAAGVPIFTKQIATPTGRLMRDAKGGDPKHWPPGNWPRQFPGARP